MSHNSKGCHVVEGLSYLRSESESQTLNALFYSSCYLLSAMIQIKNCTFPASISKTNVTKVLIIPHM